MRLPHQPVATMGATASLLSWRGSDDWIAGSKNWNPGAVCGKRVRSTEQQDEQMPSLIVTTRNGDTREVSGNAGMSVMQVIRDHGFDDLLALCGGCCSCATCHVFVDADQMAILPPMSADEDDLLDSSDARTAASRLSCQLPFGDELDGLRVTIAPED